MSHVAMDIHHHFLLVESNTLWQVSIKIGKRESPRAGEGDRGRGLGDLTAGACPAIIKPVVKHHEAVYTTKREKASPEESSNNSSFPTPQPQPDPFHTPSPGRGFPPHPGSQIQPWRGFTRPECCPNARRACASPAGRPPIESDAMLKVTKSQYRRLFCRKAPRRRSQSKAQAGRIVIIKDHKFVLPPCSWEAQEGGES
jgi:hypothetical protein